MSQEVAWRATQAALAVAEAMNYVGVLCVEFFVLGSGALVVNEIAPRPHNSGHWSIDGSVTSQFEQQVRVMAGQPLGSVHPHGPVVMLNLLGDLWFDAPDASAPREPDWSAVLRHPQAKLHLYGKAQPRRGRKMGHVNVLAETVEEATRVATRIELELGIAP